MVNTKKIDVKKEYTKWCKEIAKKTDAELVDHLREHTRKHFNRHKGEGLTGLMVWLIAIFNFVNIFKEKYRIKTDDMLFQLCMYLKEHQKGPVPKFDVDKFIKEYKGTVKNYYFQPKRLKKWKNNKNKIKK